MSKKYDYVSIISAAVFLLSLLLPILFIIKKHEYPYRNRCLHKSIWAGFIGFAWLLH